MKHVVVSIARCQGITKGHQKVFEMVDALCKKYNAEGHIYFSKTVDADKNPLEHDYRLNMCKEMMPHLSKYFKDDAMVKHIFSMVRKHSDKDTTLHVVCGGDRLVEYQYKFDKYNNTNYVYKKIIVHNAGNRTDGVSGTYLRNLARIGDFSSFMNNIPTTSDNVSGFDLYSTLRVILKTKEISDENIDRVSS